MTRRATQMETSTVGAKKHRLTRRAYDTAAAGARLAETVR